MLSYLQFWWKGSQITLSFGNVLGSGLIQPLAVAGRNNEVISDLLWLIHSNEYGNKSGNVLNVESKWRWKWTSTTECALDFWQRKAILWRSVNLLVWLTLLNQEHQVERPPPVKFYCCSQTLTDTVAVAEVEANTKSGTESWRKH